MMTKLRTRWEAAAARNSEVVRRSAARQLDDDGFDRWRTTNGRRLLAVVNAVAIALMTIAWSIDATVGLVGLAIWVLSLIALRRSVRTLADLPEEVLDERMIADRNAAYVEAYRLVAAVFTIAAMVLFALMFVRGGDGGVVLSLDADGVNAVFWATLAVLLSAPSTALAWRGRV